MSLKEEMKTIKEELDTTKKGEEGKGSDRGAGHDCKSCFQRHVVAVSNLQREQDVNSLQQTVEKLTNEVHYYHHLMRWKLLKQAE